MLHSCKSTCCVGFLYVMLCAPISPLQVGCTLKVPVLISWVEGSHKTGERFAGLARRRVPGDMIGLHLLSQPVKPNFKRGLLVGRIQMKAFKDWL